MGGGKEQKRVFFSSFLLTVWWKGVSLKKMSEEGVGQRGLFVWFGGIESTQNEGRR